MKAPAVAAGLAALFGKWIAIVGVVSTSLPILMTARRLYLLVLPVVAALATLLAAGATTVLLPTRLRTPRSTSG